MRSRVARRPTGGHPRSLLPLGAGAALLVLAGCSLDRTPLEPPGSCTVDDDCGGFLQCEASVCVEPFDAGPRVDAGPDSGIPFSPANLDGLVLRLEGLEPAAATNWPDTSGAGHDGIPTDGPVTFGDENGVRVATFTGTTHAATLPFSLGGGAGLTAFVVARIATTSDGNGRVLHTDNAHLIFSRFQEEDRVHFFVDRRSPDAQAEGLDQWHVWTLECDPTSGPNGTTRLRRDDDVLLTLDRIAPRQEHPFGVGGPSTGGGPRMQGAVGEVLVYDRRLDDVDQGSVRAFLRARYGALFE